MMDGLLLCRISSLGVLLGVWCFIGVEVRKNMQIKGSKDKPQECPEEKLKFLSFIDQLQGTRALHPVTPERRNKEWVMDPWEDHTQCLTRTPDSNQYINRMLDNYESRTCRLKKTEFLSEKAPLKASSPVRPDSPPPPVEKENLPQPERKPRPRLFTISKPARRSTVVEEDMGPFKVAVSSVVYPVIRGEDERQYGVEKGRRRMQRFHSFVARTIRR